MEAKRKKKLIKLYEDNYKDWLYWYDVQDYVGRNKYIYEILIRGSSREEEINT